MTKSDRLSERRADRRIGRDSSSILYSVGLAINNAYHEYGVSAAALRMKSISWRARRRDACARKKSSAGDTRHLTTPRATRSGA